MYIALQNLQCQLQYLSDFKITIHAEKLVNVYFKEKQLMEKNIVLFVAKY